MHKNSTLKQTAVETPNQLSAQAPVQADAQQKRLFLMGCACALGTFNDNFFKQAACLLALSLGFKEIQGDAEIIFALPFVLFSA